MCSRLMSTFPQLSTSKKEHGLMRSRGGVAQNDRSVDALQEARLNPLVSTGQHESQAPYTRIGMRCERILDGVLVWFRFYALLTT